MSWVTRQCRFKGFDTYEVLAGGHFLVHQVDVTVGNQRVQAIEVIGERAQAATPSRPLVRQLRKLRGGCG
jgi:hypothetical protein